MAMYYYKNNTETQISTSTVGFLTLINKLRSDLVTAVASINIELTDTIEEGNNNAVTSDAVYKELKALGDILDSV